MSKNENQENDIQKPKMFLNLIENREKDFSIKQNIKKEEKSKKTKKFHKQKRI